jgi:AraC family transcriptional regulator, regulatory protein of adaptative response / methylated-DNA-[protein]-cysteine methyltransferase
MLRHLGAMNAHMILEDAEAGRHYRQMGRAIRFLTDHYLEQPSLDEAASAAGLSPYHFQRLFTRYVGISPKSFVGHLTLSHAKAELAGGASVLEAALEAGLSGPSRLHDLSLKIEAMTPGDYARGGEGLTIDYGFHPSPFGEVLLMATDKGLCGLGFADEGDEASALDDMKARWPKAHYRHEPERTAALARQIFDADMRTDKPIGLHLLGTPWQIKVWEALLTIPEGKLTTYGAIAKAMNNDKASRAVGTAVGRNPISYLIPCHRVLGGDCKLHGYHWGLSRKRAMLAMEAARHAA